MIGRSVLLALKACSTDRSQGRLTAGRCRVLLYVGYLLAGMIPLAVGVVRPGITGYHRCLLQEMVYGQAYRPFVKRQLVPLIVRAGVCATPESLDARLRDAFADSALLQRLGWPPTYAPEFVLTLLVMYVSTIAFLVFLRRLLLHCLDIPPGIAHGVVLAVAVMMPVCYAGQVYIYDYTQLMLFTAALLCMLQGRWRAYYPVFALVCLNKETSILLPAVFACWKGREIFKRHNLTHLMAQGVIAVSICAVLAWIYRNNPGGDTEWHLERNLAMQFTVLAWIRLTVLLLGVVLALWGMRTAPAFLTRGFLATLPILVVSAFLFGYVDELRDYYEALPFGVGLITLVFARALK